jgi:group II intron reverse transcriptase/maturase
MIVTSRSSVFMETVQLHLDLKEGVYTPDLSSADFIATRLAESPTGDIRLMESICERRNMRKALRRVEQNKGAPGVDGMKTTQLRGYLRRNWHWIKAALLAGTYKPLPVSRTEIKKPEGGIRPLGIPAVVDRLIQQATMQVLQSIWDHTFSEFSYGFRPNRSQHMAIKRCKDYVEQGYTYVVDIDLAKFFDRVNHDRLMSTLAKRIADKRVLKYIRRCLESGVMIDGLTQPTEQGCPQGGPLSPLLSNIVLDELDKELEKRGLHFVRYADDCVIYVKSKRAGDRVMKSVARFITRRLKLQINETKSSVNRPWCSKYLGFRITKFMGKTRINIHEKSLQRFREKIREITARKRGRSIWQIVQELNEYLRGWIGYYREAISKTLADTLNKWIRRRLRAYIWKQWHLPKTKVRKHRAAGISEKWAKILGNTRKGPWRIGRHPNMYKVLPDSYFNRQLGLVLLGYRPA